MMHDLIPATQLDEITGGRTAAIGHWMRAYDAFHEATGAAARASVGGAVAFAIPSSHRDDGGDIARAFAASGMVDEYKDRQPVKVDARARFEALITKAVDRRCWSHLMTELGFDRLLDATARKEFQASLRDDPAPFTSEACAATFGNIWENRRELYLRGIATVFSKLDRRFRSHDGFKIGGRLIIERALNEWGGWTNYERRDALHDVERVFLEMEEMAPVGWDGGIAVLVEREARKRVTPCLVHGPFFRVRIFGNGNLHLWFERKDLVLKVNRLLAEYYGEAIGEGSDVADVSAMGPAYHVTPARNFGLFETPAPVVAEAFTRLDLGKLDGLRVLEPSAGRGRLADEARRRGGLVQCVEIQGELAETLRRNGHAVREADFLTLEPSDLGGLFDVIVMNPPFDLGRDCDHVRHALQFLKPGGRLVSVMSASAEHATNKRAESFRALVDKLKPIWGWRGPFRDLPDGSFKSEGTNVNTITCGVINSPRGRY